MSEYSFPSFFEREETAEKAEKGEGYSGKYRATVINNIDPKFEARLQVQCPDVTGLAPATWARCAVPSGGMQNGFVSLPVIGAAVWVEFEQGDPDFPIWTGCYYRNAGEVPALAKVVPPGVPGFAMQTPLQNGLLINDAPGPTGGILLKSGTASITINELGIMIQNGKGASIFLTNNQVIVNQGALMVQ